MLELLFVHSPAQNQMRQMVTVACRIRLWHLKYLKGIKQSTLYLFSDLYFCSRVRVRISIDVSYLKLNVALCITWDLQIVALIYKVYMCGILRSNYHMGGLPSFIGFAQRWQMSDHLFELVNRLCVYIIKMASCAIYVQHQMIPGKHMSVVVVMCYGIVRIDILHLHSVSPVMKIQMHGSVLMHNMGSIRHWELAKLRSVTSITWGSIMTSALQKHVHSMIR